jgi:acyl-CoA thioester hydrolase
VAIADGRGGVTERIPSPEIPNPESQAMPDPSFRVRCPVEVRFRDCDPMGHVNNAVYLTYLELARFAYWKAVEIGRLEGEVSYIMARVEIDFRASAKTGDALDVGIAISGFGRTSFTMEYEIRDQEARLVATAKSVQVTYDYAAGKAVPVPDSVRARIAEFEGHTFS